MYPSPDNHTDPIIHFDDVTITFPQHNDPVLKNINLTIFSGEKILILGTSGSGKTSLIRAINGLIPHLYPAVINGSISVLQKHPYQQKLYETGKNISIVLQNPRTQFFCITPESELAFGSENRGIAPQLIWEKINNTRQKLTLDHLMHKKMHDLSGGEKQCIALGAAYTDAADLYLLDEPTSNLDSSAIEEFHQSLMSIVQTGKTLLISEHKFSYLHDIIDRVIHIEKGKIVEDIPAKLFWNSAPEMRRSQGLRNIEQHSLPVRKPSPGHTGKGLLIHSPKFGKLFFPRGKITRLYGKNGIGKTTLARGIVGLSAPKIKSWLDDKPLSRKERQKKSFLVMQDVHLQLLAPTVESEITLMNQNISPYQLEQILKDFSLEEIRNHNHMHLSGGEKQRLMVAIALCDNKEVYIFDEPSSGLDLQSMIIVSTALRKLAERNKIVILITHDEELAELTVDHDYILYDPYQL